ncbi:MAG: DUF427 domain-containing protein [Deltaproteobacteria bacterium]|jgi:uncharacterized protein (DUF427 family)|nr:DUF427 domain-containing protein [Deltaproteobacteria bacterium]
MWKYRGQKRPEFAQTPGPGQESVWDYPRPPELAPDSRRVEVYYGDQMIASSRTAFRVLETASPPTFYIPPGDVNLELLSSAPGSSICEWKGAATYWSLASEPERGVVAWSYSDPSPAFLRIRAYVSFYPAIVKCFVGAERVRAQPGKFYGGWVTDEIIGPFKGEPGTQHW